MIISRRYLSDCTIGSGQVYENENLIYSFKTLELPNKGNAKRISCIPEGEYTCEKIKHEKFGNCFKLLKVNGRDGVLIHAGNYTTDTKGCVLVGKQHIDINKDNTIDITESKTTLKALYFMMPFTFNLIIKHV